MQNGPTTPRRVSMILDASTPRSGAANPQPYSPAPRLKIGTPEQSSFATELFQQLFLNGHSLIARALGDRFVSIGFNPIEAYEFLINLRTQYQITLDSVAYNKLLIGSREMFESLPDTAIGDFWFFQLHQMTKRITLDLISMSSDIQKALQDRTGCDLALMSSIDKKLDKDILYLKLDGSILQYTCITPKRIVEGIVVEGIVVEGTIEWSELIENGVDSILKPKVDSLVEFEAIKNYISIVTSERGHTHPTLFYKQNTAILKDWGRSPVYLRHNENWTTSVPSEIHKYNHISNFLACIINTEVRRRVAYFVTQEGLFGLVRPWVSEASKKSGYYLLQDQESSTIFLEVLPNGNIRLCLQIFQSYVTYGKLILPIKSPLPLVLMFEICGKHGNIIFSKAHVMANDLLIEREHQGQMILQPMPELLKIIKSIW